MYNTIRINTLRKSFFPLLLSLLALLLLSPLKLHAWELTPQGLQPVPLPASAEPVSLPVQADLNGDGHPESLALSAGRLAILSASRVVWQSREDWRVSQAAFNDLNRDGAPEVTLLVWRPFRPWPVDRWLPHGGRIAGFHDAAGESCHLILIGWKDGRYRELWAGSALAEPIRAFGTADLNGDGRTELITLEGWYDDPPSKTASRLKVWEWNGFGFNAVYTLEGRFRQMQIVHIQDGRVLILAP